MTVLGRGDLSPPRRGRSGYGRHRRRWPRVLLVLIVLAALGAGGYYGWHRWHDDNATVASPPSPCPTITPTPTSPPTAGLKVVVLNASLKPGLAKRLARRLRTDFGVDVSRVGNAATFDKGPSVVRYPVALAEQAHTIAAMLQPAPRLKADAGVATVEIDLGTAFRRSATVAEFEHSGAAPSPSATAAPSPTATSSTCTTPS